jgi:maltose/glucose-specific phosphotransferase system IIC component
MIRIIKVYKNKGSGKMEKEKKESKVFSVLQRIGRSFMFPIALLPVAGLLLGVGASFTNETMINAYHLQSFLGEGTFLHAILLVLKQTGDIIFANLPIIFALGVALGMAKQEKAVATLSAAIAYLVMNQTISSLLELTGRASSLAEGSVTTSVGIQTLQMGVFGGIIVGLGVAALHNRFYRIKLPTVISFFGGTRFIPIISTLVYILVGILMFYLWPIIQSWIYALGGLVNRSGYFGTLIYGIIERALIPFGLHHVFYLPFWQTGLGGSMMIDGNMVSGAQNIFFAQLASPNTQHFSVEATRFMAGKFPFMIFGLPGAALAMYKVAKSSKKKVAGGLLLSAALTAMITGITEPLEFTFLFVAPVLYVIHCVLAGLSFMLMHIFKVAVGMTFSGGLIDMTLFGILQGNAKTNWIYIVLVGVVYFAIYYFLFKFMIQKFNYITPGREDDEAETKLYTRKDVNAAKENKSAMILDGLGGMDNLENLDCCATRLRVTVHDSSKVNDGLLKQTGASGVIKKGNGVQVIYGPRVTVIKSEIEDYMDEIKHQKEKQ